MSKFKYLVAIFASLISPYALAHGDIKLVLYSIAVGFQLFALLILIIWGGERKNYLLIGNLLNMVVIWLLPWRETELATYYVLLYVEPIIVMVISLLISKFILAKEQKNKHIYTVDWFCTENPTLCTCSTYCIQGYFRPSTLANGFAQS